jgi:hypothetical protein
MNFGTLLRICLALVGFGGSSLAAYLLHAYMTEYSLPAPALLALPAIGFASAAVILFKLRLESKISKSVATIMLATVLLIYPASCFIGRVTYARFGVTTYGLLPIPALDIVVHDNGVLWFRDKSHRVSREEIDAVVSGETEVLIIGKGWDGVLRVDEDALNRQGIEIRVLRTPDAIATFNKLRQDGIKVALICHSTC